VELQKLADETGPIIKVRVITHPCAAL
jgi:hypothetical protein